MTTHPRFDLPVPDDDTRPFWDAAKDHRLLVRHCRACGRFHFYPRSFCPHCWSDAVEWHECSGRGTLYTYSTVCRNDVPPFDQRVPYVAAIVDLEEGVRMMTTVDIDLGQLQVGMRLVADFRTLNDDFTIPVFRAATGEPSPDRPGPVR